MQKGDAVLCLEPHDKLKSTAQTLGRDDAGNRRRSLAAAAEAQLRGSARAGETGPASPTAESVRAEEAHLIDWRCLYE